MKTQLAPISQLLNYSKKMLFIGECGCFAVFVDRKRNLLVLDW